MKRVTILVDDESLYRDVKAEAAKEGRSVNVVAEALRAWLRGRGGLTPAQRAQRMAALSELDELRSRQPAGAWVDGLLAQVRGGED